MLPTSSRRTLAAVTLLALAMATTTGCRARYAVPTGLVLGTVAGGAIGHEVADEDKTLGTVIGAIPGVLVGTLLGLLIGIGYELQQANDDE